MIFRLTKNRYSTKKTNPKIWVFLISKKEPGPLVGMDRSFNRDWKNSKKERKRAFDANGSVPLLYLIGPLVRVHLERMRHYRKKKYIGEMINEACSLTEL